MKSSFLFVFVAFIIFFLLHLLYKFFTSENKNKKETTAGVIGGVTGAFLGKSIGIAAFGGAIAGTIPLALASAAMAVLAVKAFSNKKEKIYKLSNGDEYCGPIKNNLPNGYGVMVFKNGDHYIGEFKDGLFNGYGNFVSKDGDKYEGKFKDGERHDTSFISPTFFWFCLVGVFILSLFFLFSSDNKKSKDVVDNWRLKGVYEDESKACEKQIIQKNPNVSIVELKSYKSFQIIRDNNQIKKIITYDVKKNVFILGEMSFGTFDCYLDLKNDATFSILRLVQK
jgi:hypothetical protein